MRQLAKLSFVIVLFGQFGFSAVGYYAHIPNPSWPFWATLYAISGMLALRHITQPKLTIPDIYFGAFIIYVAISFALVGESNTPEFIQRVALICVAPYVAGRLLGKYVPLYLAGTLQVLSFLYLALLAVELVRNPALFQADRLLLYTPEQWDGAGGDPTSFNIGITLGAAWVAAFAYLTFASVRESARAMIRARPWLLAVVVGFPVVLLFVGSRTSVVSIALCAIVLLACASWISTRSKVGWLIFTVAGLLVFYHYLPEQRKLLINEIPSALFQFEDYAARFSVCGPGGSVFDRVAQLNEAWRLFLQSPLFGIGATNFGFRYCGDATEFGSPHSLFAHVLVEYGLVGAVLLALMLTKILRAFLWRMRSSNYHARLAAWSLFGIWTFVLLQVQFVGNLFYDYHVFLLTGLFVSCLYNSKRWAVQPYGGLRRGAAVATPFWTTRFSK